MSLLVNYDGPGDDLNEFVHSQSYYKYMQGKLTRVFFVFLTSPTDRTKLLSNYKDFLIHFYSDL